MTLYCGFDWYADFDWYVEIYGGTAVSESDFARLAYRAQAIIDQITFNRIKALTENEIPDEAKMALCAAVDVLYYADANDGHVVISETVSKHAVTYGDVAKSTAARAVQIAKTYLDGSGLTYRGVYHDEWNIQRHRPERY